MKTRTTLIILVILTIITFKQVQAVNTPRQIMENMLAAQKSLRNFSAQITLKTKLGPVPLLPISGSIYSERPSKVRATIAGLTFSPKHPFLFPDPLQFVGEGYTLSLAGTEDLGGEEVYVIDVQEKEPTENSLNLRFWISSASWLILQSDTAIAGEGRTLMRARYIQAQPNAWVPVELSGNGGLLLADLLPPSFLGNLLSGVAKSDNLSFTAVLSDHQVNLESQ